jgi:hypothetical protein
MPDAWCWWLDAATARPVFIGQFDVFTFFKTIVLAARKRRPVGGALTNRRRARL